MKKLLILLLVFGLASTANAVITQYTLETDGLVVNVQGTAGSPVGGHAIFSGAVIDFAVPQTAPMPIYGTTAGNLGNNNYTAGDFASASAATLPPDVAVIFALVSPAPGDSIDAGLWFTIDIDDVSTAGWGIGQIVDTLSVFDATTGAQLGTVDVISTVPEPITIALLGLGGLFLRRRK